jgi:hypothetical protein
MNYLRFSAKKDDQEFHILGEATTKKRPNQAPIELGPLPFFENTKRPPIFSFLT